MGPVSVLLTENTRLIAETKEDNISRMKNKREKKKRIVQTKTKNDIETYIK